MAGPLYAAIYLLALVPGLPLGFRLFGRRHAGGWIAGALLGYTITSLACWAAGLTGQPSTLLFAFAGSGFSVVAWAPFPVRPPAASEPLVVLPPWTARDSAALLLVL